MSDEEKAINLLQSADIDETGDAQWHTWYKGIDKDIKKAFDVAIKALEQQNELFKMGLLKDCESCKAQSCNLNKIIAEIDSYCGDNRDRNDGLYIAMQIIDKYKAESE